MQRANIGRDDNYFNVSECRTSMSYSRNTQASSASGIQLRNKSSYKSTPCTKSVKLRRISPSSATFKERCKPSKHKHNSNKQQYSSSILSQTENRVSIFRYLHIILCTLPAIHDKLFGAIDLTQQFICQYKSALTFISIKTRILGLMIHCL